jgi:selenocysteine lyase/cysteine desulfurase
MQTYPLEQLTLDEATQLQFRLVEAIARHFDGQSILQAGDYGLWQEAGRPQATQRVEAALADFFAVEAACLTRGAGTGALRQVLMALLKPGDRLMVHQSPVYPTSAATVEAMGLQLVRVDFNDLGAIQQIDPTGIKCILIQHTRQRQDDRYHLGQVIQALLAALPGVCLVVDDNYAALRAKKIGIQLGANVSTFSLFKLLGPEGLGLVLGDQRLIDRIHIMNYSGGTQVQGTEAMEALRALVYAPVALAIQAEVVAEVARRLNAGEVSGVRHAHIANAQSRVVLVELEQPLAPQVIERSAAYGAAIHPVGAESRYEVAPLFYRVSGTFLADTPGLADHVIRINPMRAGADLILTILRSSLQDCQGG